MLVYVLLTSYFTAIAISIPLYQNIQQNYTRFSEGDWKYEEAWDICALFIIVFIDIAVAFLITVFLKFHFMLLSQNKTTIENLEAKGKFFVSRFDKGLFDNFYQVFGTNMYLWPFPAYFESGKPLGDGVNWVIKQQEEKVEYVEDNESKTIKKRGVKSDDGDETDVNSHQNHNSNQPNMNNDKSKGYGKIVINPQLTITNISYIIIILIKNLNLKRFIQKVPIIKAKHFMIQLLQELFTFYLFIKNMKYLVVTQTIKQKIWFQLLFDQAIIRASLSL